jgi:multidrug efflux pump subunit AcrA (membrane-fusion protein)
VLSKAAAAILLFELLSGLAVTFGPFHPAVEWGVLLHSMIGVLTIAPLVAADETKIAHVHVKINGFIEQVFVDYIGQLVKKGQPLFTIYSPDLVSTQEEYLIAKRGEKTLRTS